MKYYFLAIGDYIQSGDEYEKSKDVWVAINSVYYGCRYGYYMKTDDRVTWLPVRRLVPDDFLKQKRQLDVQITEQWGEEFEL